MLGGAIVRGSPAKAPLGASVRPVHAEGSRAVDSVSDAFFSLLVILCASSRSVFETRERLARESFFHKRAMLALSIDSGK